MKKLLPVIRKLCDGMLGQNHWFHGCMEYLMECLGESNEYNYWFFSGVTGDSFMQIYSKNVTKMTLCYTHNHLVNVIHKVFDACGYHFDYIRGINDSDRNVYDERIKGYINKNVPIIAKLKDKNGWNTFSVICGYDDHHLYYLMGDHAEPDISSNPYDDLIFIKEKKERPSLSEVYRQTIMGIPSLITMPETEDYSFGKRAFIDWAESFQNGSFDHLPADDRAVWYTHEESAFSCWNVHGTYLCMLGTNGCSTGFLRKALELNPDMTWFDKLIPLYEKQNGHGFSSLIGMEGGFSIKPEVVKNKELMEPISAKILEIAKYSDDILEVFNSISLPL